MPQVIEQQVSEIVREVLGLDGGQEVAPRTDLVDELGAESIDFIDICFRLEKTFRIGKVNPGDIFPTFLRTTPFLEADGTVSAAVMERLSREYPHLERGLLAAFAESKDRRRFVTVESLIAFVTHRQA
jgi:acyl carrier protein